MEYISKSNRTANTPPSNEIITKIGDTNVTLSQRAFYKL